MRWERVSYIAELLEDELDELIVPESQYNPPNILPELLTILWKYVDELAAQEMIDQGQA